MTSPIAYQADTMAVALYNTERFVTHYDWTYGREGNVNPVLHARFASTEGEFDGYAKPFNIRSTHDATTTLNEVTGWLLARASGLPCPERAFFIAIPANTLPSYGGLTALPPEDAHGNLLCFVTQSASSAAVRALFDTQLLVREQSTWSHCDNTIAFDEGIANADRHAFNLLRRGEKDFVLIDHGFLLRDAAAYPTHWEDGSIESKVVKGFDNLLHNNTYHFLNRTTPPVRSAACAKGLEFREKLESAIRRSTFEIAFWCSQLLPGASARWLRFLYSRVQQAPMAHLLAQRYGLLNIHV